MFRINSVLIASTLVALCLLFVGVQSFIPTASATKEGKTCCLPLVHSYSATFYEKKFELPQPPQPNNNGTQPSNNGTQPQPPQPNNNGTQPQPGPVVNGTQPVVNRRQLKQAEPDSIIVKYSLDLVTFRRRELTIVKSNNTELIFNTIRFKAQDSYTYEYRIEPNKCKCSKFKNLSWKNTCITSNSETINFNIGNVVGSITMMDMYGSKVQYTTMAEPYLRDTCWITSKTWFLSDSVQDYKYFGMNKKVDDKDFEIPSQCPPITECN